MHQPHQTKTHLQAILDIEAREQAEFDEQTEAYIQASDDMQLETRESHASRLDTNNRHAWELHPDKRFDFAVVNWNDTLDADGMWERCGQIAETLRRHGAGKQKPARDTLTDIHKLLDNSFSENIKHHIVTLTASTETVEGACRHCLGFYGEMDSENRDITIPIAVWQGLCNLIGTAQVYHAFLERAWHLNPTSKHFPNRYRDIVKAVRHREHDRSHRLAVPYATPYEQLEALSETAKELRYAMRHTTDAKEKSRLANAQVKVLGAMYILNAKLETKHNSAVSDAQRAALTA